MTASFQGRRHSQRHTSVNVLITCHLGVFYENELVLVVDEHGAGGYSWWHPFFRRQVLKDQTLRQPRQELGPQRISKGRYPDKGSVLTSMMM